MERSERLRLEAIKRQLHKGLTSVDELLQHADPPQRLSKAAVRKRAQSICQAMQKQGGTASRDELRMILAEHGMRFTAMGGLVGAGYLRTTRSGFALAKRGTISKQGRNPATSKHRRQNR